MTFRITAQRKSKGRKEDEERKEAKKGSRGGRKRMLAGSSAVDYSGLKLQLVNGL